jgi:ribA/ribD-fused uncharacterized protein
MILSENLAASRTRVYTRDDCIVFHKTKDAFGGLSNMASGYPLRVNGVRILTTEALYQACRFPHLPEVQKEIIGQHSPMTAKMKGKPFRDQSRRDWDDVRAKVMRWCLRVKLAQNYDRFAELLLATREKSIVEYSPRDEYWGARELNQTSLGGENVLGRLLMELRELIKIDIDRRLTVVAPLQIPNFHLFGKPIESVFGSNTPAELIPKQTQLLL